MIIEIVTADNVTHEIELERNGENNENGTVYYYLGEHVDSKGETIKIEALQHRNHPTVSSEDIKVSGNVLTTLDAIADLINEQLSKNDE
jgi:hypothetical protein